MRVWAWAPGFGDNIDISIEYSRKLRQVFLIKNMLAAAIKLLQACVSDSLFPFRVVKDPMLLGHACIYSRYNQNLMNNCQCMARFVQN